MGDKEQSIFSFAAASLETYERAIAKLPAHPLTVNYRSTARIVALLNVLVVHAGSEATYSIPQHSGFREAKRRRGSPLGYEARISLSGEDGQRSPSAP